MKVSIAVATVLLATSAANAVHAQEKAAKPQWMSMQELRSCVALQDKSTQTRTEAQTLRPEVEKRMNALKAEQADLKKREETEKNRTKEQAEQWSKDIAQFRKNSDEYKESVKRLNDLIAQSNEQSKQFNDECATKVAEDKDIAALEKELNRKLGDWKNLGKVKDTK